MAIPKDDAQLIREARGEPEAFAELYRAALDVDAGRSLTAAKGGDDRVEPLCSRRCKT